MLLMSDRNGARTELSVLCSVCLVGTCCIYGGWNCDLPNGQAFMLFGSILTYLLLLISPSLWPQIYTQRDVGFAALVC